MSPAPHKPAPVRFGIAARLSAAFLGLAGLAAVAGASSSWFSLQSAGIVSALGSRTLPTVTASLSFARQNAILAAEAPGLASQTSLGGLAQHAEQIDGMLAAQAEGLARLRGRVGVPDQLEAIERHNRDLAPKIADLKAAAAERIGVADKMQVAVGEALSRYQDLMDFVRPLQEALQTAVGGDIDALGKGNSGATQTLATDLKTLQAAMDVQANANLAFGMLSAVANASDSALSDIGTQYNWAEVYLGKGLKAFGSGADADRLAPLVKALLDIGAGPSGVFTLRNQATDIGGRVNGLLNDLNAGSAVLSEDVKVLVHTEEDLAQKAVDRSAAVTRQTLGVNAATSGLVIVAALLIGIVYVRRSITRRLIRLAGVMGRLAAGDRTATVATGGRDEITAMAAAVGVFRDNMLAADRLAGEASRLTAQREAERAATERERALAAEQQATVVQGLARGLTDLAHGKLSQEIVTPFAPDYESLRLDFNDALGRLRAAMREVVENADQLRSGTDEIAGAADDLSRRTENQAASLEQTAAALGEVTGALRKTADGAVHARDIVGAAKAHVEQSGKVIQDAVAAMGAIEASSGEIGQIIGVVDEIAFQTSLLALNAGVEAARAGEAGRGFAVVASEVRTLAQRSAEAAKQIKALVSASRTQVSHGVALVGQGGIALERVLSEVSEINAIVSEIARAAGEQTLGLEQVNVAVTQMDQVTQQNAAMVEETTAASHHLAQEIAALTRSMGRFQLGDAAPAAVAHPPRQAASRPAVASRGRTGGAATALMAEAEVDEGWSEF